MKNKRNGFTLMELLAVVVILGITFLFIMPSVTSLMGLGERREIELIEERVLFAAKEYVNNYDSTFYNSFYKEGDTNYVYKSDLINTGLIDKNGYMIYKADEHNCSGCPFKSQCTKSKCKQILRHVWE